MKFARNAVELYYFFGNIIGNDTRYPVRASCANSYTIVLSWEYSFGICAYRRLTTIKVEDATKRAFYFVTLQDN